MSLTNLLAAIIIVESGNNDMAIGDNGKALGPLQIHRSVVIDANRISGRAYRWERMTNRTEAIQVAEIYLRHYGLGKSEEHLARIWNGGPQGYKKSATTVYWNKVKNQMNSKAKP